MAISVTFEVTFNREVRIEIFFIENNRTLVYLVIIRQLILTIVRQDP